MNCCQYGCYPTNAQNNKKNIKCCCKSSMKKALELLGHEGIRESVDFNAFAFLTDFYIVGSPLIFLSLLPDTKKDNLSAALDASLNKLPGCNCDTLDITGRALYPVPLPIDDLTGILTALVDVLESLGIGLLAPLIEVLRDIIELGDAVIDPIIALLLDLFSTLPNVELASLCKLKSVAFQTLSGPSINPSVTHYQSVRYKLKCLLDKYREKDDCNPKCDECCCNEGILREIAGSNIIGTVTLTAGSLTLQDVEVIGNIENVIVLGNEGERKIYFVCADSISLIG